jgi:transcriptional regulator with XRE-family HTH domain
METMERDPQFIADQVRLLRKLFRLTQENLAEAANLSTRTIEKVESGRHRPDEQTLRSIARALGFDVRVFEKPTPEQEARQKFEMERAVRKSLLVVTSPVRTAGDFLSRFKQGHAARIDTGSVEGEEALEIAAAMTDWLTELNDVWDDCSHRQRLECARGFAQLCERIEAFGYLCHMGAHRQRLRERGTPDLVFSVTVMSIQPKDESNGERYVLAQLEGAWETLEEDRPAL